MKFNCGDSPLEKSKKLRLKLENWHSFFALLPRRVGPGDCRWLETIERKGEFYCYCGDAWWEWQYRPVQRSLDNEGK